jgi:hypothetical protein
VYTSGLWVTELGKGKNAASVAALLKVRKQLAAASKEYASAVSDAQRYGRIGS